MNAIATHRALPQAPAAAPLTAQVLAAIARVFARIAAAFRRAASARRRAGHTLDPHVGERVALGGLGPHLLRDIGASPSLLAHAAGAAHDRAPERVLAGLY